MFAEELKKGTASVHAELEKKLIPHIRQVKDRESYTRLLKLMYGFYHPLQQKLQPFLDRLNYGSHYRGRQAESIVSDIGNLQPSGEEKIQETNHLPEIKNYAAALGALYVTEGSTLGGKIIAGMIARQVPQDLSRSLSFFNAYGDDTKPAWENFREMLNQPFSEEEKEQIIATARETFSSFKKWLSEYESGTDQ
jgi:heme oxygenase (biliverdin-IX-beta and delta-forming)